MKNNDILSMCIIAIGFVCVIIGGALTVLHFDDPSNPNGIAGVITIIGGCFYMLLGTIISLSKGEY